ncbi:MAG: ornithine cyclodeaminase [Marmoricola sp.]|jgi:ornithine cyclodeaminase/alanine dehydrogenase-like protein (mu-crystallin family)|nr:ornithine cyclodeaminase [Marmoricola sp.]
MPDYPGNADPGNDFTFLNEAEVAAIFSPSRAIQSQRDAFLALGRGTAVLPDKLMVANTRDGSVAFCYAARLSPEDGAVSKFGSINPANPARHLPSISAVIVVLDVDTGRPMAIMDGTIITTRRTAAASAVAVDALSRVDAKSLAVLGCGVQGREHVRMLALVRSFDSVHLWSRDPQSCAAAATLLGAETGLNVIAHRSAEEAVRGADVVVASTLSPVPVVEGRWLEPGATVVSIGSISPDRCEVGADVVRSAGLVAVDDPDTAAAHAGPIVGALEAGHLKRSDLVGLGDILVGRHPGRSGPGELVYYNSTGLGIQDAAAAKTVVDAARLEGIGSRLSLAGSNADRPL